MQLPSPLGQNPSLPLPTSTQIITYWANSIRKATPGGVISILANGGSPLMTLDDASGVVTFPFIGGASGVVSLGAADSGGAGFKLLRVPN